MNDHDMSKMEFHEILKDVASFFGTPKDQQMEIMYDIFKAYPFLQMKKACRFLIEHHDNRYFPTPRDIHEALREVAELTTPQPTDDPKTPEELDHHRCETCRGVGWWVEYKFTGQTEHPTAIYCHCPKGQKMKLGYTAYMRRYHQRGV